jgi:hypothetical protein
LFAAASFTNFFHFVVTRSQLIQRLRRTPRSYPPTMAKWTMKSTENERIRPGLW